MKTYSDLEFLKLSKGEKFKYKFLSFFAGIPRALLNLLLALWNLIKGAGWTTFSDAFTFVHLIVILMVKPTGLFGEKNIDKV